MPSLNRPSRTVQKLSWQSCITRDFRRFFLARRARIRAFFRSRRDRGGRNFAIDGPAAASRQLSGVPRWSFSSTISRSRWRSCDARAVRPEELRQTYSGGGLRWDDPLSSLEKIAVLRDPRGSWSGEYSGYVKLLGEREKLELSLYAQSARAHIMSLRDSSGSVNAIKELLKDIEDTCRARRFASRLDALS